MPRPPKDKPHPRITLTPEILEALRGHIRRTGKGVHAILRDCPGKPGGLKAATISGWLSGTHRTARRDHLDYVLRRFEESDELEPVTPAIQDRLKSHLARTGTSAYAMGRKMNISPAILYGWCNGTIEKASARKLHDVLDALGALPDRRERWE